MTRKLQTLKPRLQAADLGRVKTLDTKAGATERIRGRKWMTTRERIALAHDYTCSNCGGIWISSRDQIDHKIPLEQGGSNEDSNLWPLCNDCHTAKTATEAKARAGR